MVKLEDLRSGDKCKMKVSYDGHSVGTVVVFSHMSQDKKDKPVGIFSPDGEPDMQSMMMLYAKEVGPYSDHAIVREQFVVCSRGTVTTYLDDNDKFDTDITKSRMFDGYGEAHIWITENCIEYMFYQIEKLFVKS